MTRRIIQLLCLGLFLALVFYVSWPYSARPARTWSGLTPLEVEAATGAAVVEADHLDEPPAAGTVLTLVDPSQRSIEGDPTVLARVVIAEVQGRRVKIRPAEPLTPAAIEKLAFSLGPWALRELAPGAWPSHYADDLAAKETLPAETFLLLDPLVGPSAALAGRTWTWALVGSAAILLLGLIAPRAFCGYLCPLGTLIDLSNASIGRLSPARRRVRTAPARASKSSAAVGGKPTEGLRWALRAKSFLRAARWGILAIVLAAAATGVLLAGFVAAIPLVTRGLVFLVKPVHDGLVRGWHNVPPLDGAQIAGAAILLGVLLLGLVGRRLWCRCLCPSGAVLSLLGRVGLFRRRVTSACTGCARCRSACTMDAIAEDFSTRAGRCITCRTCASVCKAEAIRFVPGAGKTDGETPETASARERGETPRLQRRDVLAASAGLSLCALGGAGLGWALLRSRAAAAGQSPDAPVRPPGSVDEEQFLRLCVRCGQCFRACPNDAIQPMPPAAGAQALWTPQLRPEWSGCETSCSNCGRVCPTGAIRPLSLDRKRRLPLGLAVINCSTCLPHAQTGPCQLCKDECDAAGYQAIEFVRVGTRVDAAGNPVEDSGFFAPVVRADRCVGCGLCQTRCHVVNVLQKKLIGESAVIVRSAAPAG